MHWYERRQLVQAKSRLIVEVIVHKKELITRRKPWHSSHLGKKNIANISPEILIAHLAYITEVIGMMNSTFLDYFFTLIVLLLCFYYESNFAYKNIFQTGTKCQAKSRTSFIKECFTPFHLCSCFFFRLTFCCRLSFSRLFVSIKVLGWGADISRSKFLSTSSQYSCEGFLFFSSLEQGYSHPLLPLFPHSFFSLSFSYSSFS